MTAILKTTKKHAISRGHLGCLGDVATVNATRGCAGHCVFCYARCLPGGPEPGALLVAEGLPEQLHQELERRRRPLPSYVLFSTAGDPFLGGEAVAQLSRACLKVLLEHQIGIYLSTRGNIPDDVIELFSRHAAHVRITVPLVSLSEEYTATWEPGTSLPRQRLFLLQRLLGAGLPGVHVRFDPLIPFVNDQTEEIQKLSSALAALGLKSARVSFMHVRPGVVEQVQREAPPEIAHLLVGSFASATDAELLPQLKFHHLPVRLRLATLRRIQRVAREHDVRVSACHCQNPGLPGRPCPVEPPEPPLRPGEQLTLLE